MKIPAACFDCGTILDRSVRKFCDECWPEVQTEQCITLGQAGPAALAKLRAAGTDPAHGGEAGKARGRRNAKHHAAVAEWEREEVEQPESVQFTRDILPILQSVSLRVMADATGLTEGYCSFIRRGQKVPHRRHWERLARLVERQP